MYFLVPFYEIFQEVHINVKLLKNMLRVFVPCMYKPNRNRVKSSSVSAIILPIGAFKFGSFVCFHETTSPKS